MQSVSVFCLLLQMVIMSFAHLVGSLDPSHYISTASCSFGPRKLIFLLRELCFEVEERTRTDTCCSGFVSRRHLRKM